MAYGRASGRDFMPLVGAVVDCADAGRALSDVNHGRSRSNEAMDTKAEEEVK